MEGQEDKQMMDAQSSRWRKKTQRYNFFLGIYSLLNREMEEGVKDLRK